MKRRITATIAHALRRNSIRESVHFHTDSEGRAFVCDYDRCDSPAVGEVSVSRER
jgi:hypothetical protein